MRNSLNASRYNQFLSAKSITVALVGLSLAVCTALTGILPAYTTESSAKVKQSAQVPSQVGVLPDGVYLYGQSDKPDVIGKGYFVFESKQGAVIGALYMPSSSFDCAAGSFKDNELSLKVTNSYDRATNPFNIALERTSNVASSTNPALPQVGLQGFYKLSQVTANDYRILNMCKTALQPQGK